MSFISQFQRQIRNYIYNPVYKGPWEYKKTNTKTYKYPFGINKKNLENVFDDIKEIRAKQIKDDEISPFHVVWRYKPFGGNEWNIKLILRRLGLHHKQMGIPVIIPNTPHYNNMLSEVKHLIRVKPLKFPDGFPKETDIGSIKFNRNTGEMKINSAYRIPQEMIDKSDFPLLYQGKYMREYLKWASGLIGRSLPNLEVDDKDGNKIEEYDKRMKNYYKHQHKFYNS